MKNIKEKLGKNWIYPVMLAIGICVCLLPGEWVSIEDDSEGYLTIGEQFGVMPVYPLFLGALRALLGARYYLDGAVVVQSFLAIFCTMWFVREIKKQFELQGWEGLLLYIACLLPFTIYLPEVGITHQIMTESITYAIFYLFFWAVLKGIWTLRPGWYLAAMGFALLLGLTRSQLIFLQAVCVCMLIWIGIRKSRAGAGHKALAFLGSFLLAMALALVSIKMTYTLLDRYEQFGESLQQEAETQETAGPGLEQETQEAAGEGLEQETQETAGEGQTAENPEIHMSQIDSLIVIKGFLEADAEDEALFEDEMMKYIFRYVYEEADEAELLYIHAKPGLYMWQDLVHDNFGALTWHAIESYDREYPGVRQRDSGSITRELGGRLLLKHFDRYLYHTLRIMIPSFIATVFFQIEPIYLLCHFVALFLYLAAAAGCFICGRCRGRREIIEMMAASLIFMVLMVIIVNMVFLGLQRYVVYGMGIYYCSLYLLLREILLQNNLLTGLFKGKN